jgi:hypothetical protein
MIRYMLPAAVLMLAACNPSTPANDVESTTTPAAGESVSDSDAPLDDTLPEIDVGTPEQKLQTWANSLEARDWEAARQIWGDSGATSGMTAEEFAAAYEKYATINITVDEGQEEGAAGSIYYEANVTMEGELQNGEAYRMEGPVVLKRVNDVPGSSTEQRTWHIATSDLRPRAIPKNEN